jgi:copper chaperone CopZ
MVQGMTCGHCAAAVKDEIGAVPGVTDVDVDLVPEGASRVTVQADGPIEDSQVIAAIAEAGYELAP